MRPLLLLAVLFTSVAALNVSFTNCLPKSVTSPNFQPFDVSASFDASSQSISYSILGNMTGQINDTNADNTLASAVTNTISVAGYIRSKTDTRLCTIAKSPLLAGNASACPFGPGPVLIDFTTQLNSSFIFSSITSEIRINGPTATDYEVGCLQLTITPPFSKTINQILTYIPMAILIMVGLKVVLAALANPWSGTIDPYRAFANFGLDPNAIRLLTPGFSDCLMYLQFVSYTSMLYVDYPGFFQLATSRVAWSMLLFENSPISGDLHYTPQSGDSIATFINFVGARRQDAWKSFMVWWFILVASVVGMSFLLLGAWWLVTPSSTDLTRKSLPFTGGTVLRVYYWLLLPMSIFTSYQLVTAQQAHAALTALSALVFMLLVLLLPVSLVYFIPRHEPRQDLYDDLSLLNLFGPLYNTFQEHAILSFVPSIIFAVLRGLTIGFLQQYGAAQIVLLTIFEVATFITLMILRPWPQSSNTTILTLLLSGARFVIVLLMVPFLPSLNITSGKREWVGYIILIIHASILVLGFLGNALLSLLELAIRLLVIVPQDEGARAIFGARQLRSRRRNQSGENGHQHNATSSANSLSGLLDNKEASPFFRRPRAPSRMSTRLNTESSFGDFRSTGESDGFVSPFGQDLAYPSSSKNAAVVRSLSYTSEEVLNLSSRPGTVTPSRPEHDNDMYDLALAPTEDAARRGVDYAVREADVYHPQSSGELLGPSKKLGTGPADPNGVKFRKIKWAPWKKEKNEEKGKFVVVRSTPAPQRPASVPMQELSSPAAGHEPEYNSHSPTRYATLYEDEEEENETDLGEYHYHDDDMQPYSRRRVVNDSSPMIPQLQLQSESPFLQTTPGQDYLTGSSPFSDVHNSTDYRVSERDRRASMESDSSYVSILATPSRPRTGERVSSHHSVQTDGSVRSALVRDSYTTLDHLGDFAAGESAELVDLDLDE